MFYYPYLLSFQRFRYAIALSPLNSECASTAELAQRLLMAFTSTLITASSSSPSLLFPFTLTPSKPLFPPNPIAPSLGLRLSVKAQTLEFSGSFFEGGFGAEDEPPAPPGTGFADALEDKEEPQCPPGLRKYESMVILRPDMSEDERLALTQKYEENSWLYGNAVAEF
ncbi:30S ribosomal protein S6 alpha, chloroplastic-like isoform X1 [Cucurbita pepo subsp. pepo]|uniref:30S ribosomal protein S6 alpha, chloroplastic-like isoform X1 n=1 Tax=Cucurbita pepo subsp. pepo TaxID=3664 RepID=UPI000C9D8E9F|nr:30S ribosomal protein S6 alpha, chloroplastic-like isoform X1 [Cucurbita pepo subsp. pepo]